MVGTVGKILGDAGVNIAGMQVSRNEKGGQALVALSVDSPGARRGARRDSRRDRRRDRPSRQPHREGPANSLTRSPQCDSDATVSRIFWASLRGAN